ncbi:MAG: aminobenzoyl-glutamate transporter [Epulopiscium sp. Nele67-Bin002]|nr:MAG: aminobenzoyl-glutamate transporter [Epulopiscium sp. Nele67-Bin002]
MKQPKEMSLIEKIGKKIPDPAILFMILYAIVITLSVFMGGMQFGQQLVDGEIVPFQIQNMLSGENIRWIYSNALLANWLGYGGGVLGVILIIMFGIGMAEDSGLLSTLIKKAGMNVSDKFLPVLLVFLGILSNIASDAGYIVLVPLAGLLYAGMKKNPLIGMVAAFAGVSAGFSANLIPAATDVIVGENAQIFAANQNVPFVSATGAPLDPALMNYYFVFLSTFILAAVGGIVTIKVVQPKLEKESYIIPKDLHLDDFAIKPEENKALGAAGLGLIVALIYLAVLYMGPLAPYYNEAGVKVNPFTSNIILMITALFFVPGLFYGVAIKKYTNSGQVIQALARQVGSMGYVLVLTFFSYNFLAMLTRSGIGTYITFLGATGLENLGFADYPTLLIIGFILTTALINLFVGGLSSKWLLLGPIFIPMLYQVHPSMTPDLVAAAYRVADSSTNIITPMMSYAGVVLSYMRKYKPEFTIGDLIRTMFPYSIAFLIIWTTLLIIFFQLGIPLGPTA